MSLRRTLIKCDRQYSATKPWTVVTAYRSRCSLPNRRAEWGAPADNELVGPLRDDAARGGENASSEWSKVTHDAGPACVRLKHDAPQGAHGRLESRDVDLLKFRCWR